MGLFSAALNPIALKFPKNHLKVTFHLAGKVSLRHIVVNYALSCSEIKVAAQIPERSLRPHRGLTEGESRGCENENTKFIRMHFFI